MKNMGWLGPRAGFGIDLAPGPDLTVPIIRFRLLRGLYTNSWVLALCLDGLPRYKASYEKFEDALTALKMTLQTQVFLGYPTDRPY